MLHVADMSWGWILSDYGAGFTGDGDFKAFFYLSGNAALYVSGTHSCDNCCWEIHDEHDNGHEQFKVTLYLCRIGSNMLSVRSSCCLMQGSARNSGDMGSEEVSAKRSSAKKNARAS